MVKDYSICEFQFINAENNKLEIITLQLHNETMFVVNTNYWLLKLVDEKVDGEFYNGWIRLVRNETQTFGPPDLRQYEVQTLTMRQFCKEKEKVEFNQDSNYQFIGMIKDKQCIKSQRCNWSKS